MSAGTELSSSAGIEPFPIAVSEAALADLADRLGRTRWPDPEPVDDWSQGLPLAYLQDLCASWADGYDWRATEARLNGFGSFRTEIDGVGIWFLHARSPHDDAVPLVITHGWPGSVIEFHKVIGPLTDPTAHGGDAADAFHVICPSLPGYGFSDPAAETGWGVERIADTWAELMARLGYERFGAQGGDWGAMITTMLALRHADRLIGVHLNMPLALPDPTDATPDETAALESIAHYQRWDSGYSTQQSTRPQTVGYGLVDSPAAQAAWVIEKFWSWTDCDGHPENVLSRDELLDNVMLYWLPGAGASSARLYWESFKTFNLDPVTVPTACSIFPKEIFRMSERWARTRFTDLRYYNRPDKGGHFAAFEQPELFVDEIRAAFRTMR
jgi:pimeloyl-ACP methyl ester carboxylesterase